MVSVLSIALAGSNCTRLLKQGAAGNTVEIVELSWIAKPCERSSRSMTFRVPPDFGAWLWAGAAKVSVATMKPRVAIYGKARERGIDASLGCSVTEFT